MKQLEKYAAAQKALKLMAQPGGKGRRFFADLMKRQKGIDNFGPDSQMNLLRGFAGEGSGSSILRKDKAFSILKRLLRQGSSYADDFTHLNSTIPKITQTARNQRTAWRAGERDGPSMSRSEEVLRNRNRQLDAADDHAFVLRRQQEAKRTDASEMDRLLSYLGQ